MQSRNLDFVDALRMLADQAGVSLPEKRPSPEQEEAHRRLYDVMLAAAGWFNHQLLKGPSATAARHYLEGRGIQESTIEAFQLGYAPDDWHSLEQYLISRSFTLEELLSAGLTIKRDSGVHYDRFRGRIVYPILDINSRVVGFGGRVLDDTQPKYLNSPETPIFTKGSNLYAIDKARSSIRETNRAVVVEGYMDVLAAHQRGYRNVVASLGTSITEYQIRTLKRYTKNIILALDADSAGAEATLRGLEVARENMDRVVTPVPTWRGFIQYEQRLDANLQIAILPEGKDPDDILRDDPAQWAWLIVHAVPVVDYYIDAILARADLSSPRGIGDAVSRLAPVLGEVIDPTARAVYTQRLADKLKIDGRRLSDRIAEARGRIAGQIRRQAKSVQAEEPEAQAEGTPPGSDNPVTLTNVVEKHKTTTRHPDEPASRVERYLLSLVLEYPEVWPLLDQAVAEEFNDAISREVLRRCLAWDGRWSLQAFVESLDVAIRPVVVELAGRGGFTPRLVSPGLEREIRELVAELRRSNLRRKLQQLYHMKRDAEEAGDTETLRSCIIRTKELLGQLSPLEMQGRAKAFVWRQ
jgi:DNA primase